MLACVALPNQPGLFIVMLCNDLCPCGSCLGEVPKVYLGAGMVVPKRRTAHASAEGHVADAIACLYACAGLGDGDVKPIPVGRHDYTVRSLDPDSGAERWNVTYAQLKRLMPSPAADQLPSPDNSQELGESSAW